MTLSFSKFFGLFFPNFFGNLKLEWAENRRLKIEWAENRYSKIEWAKSEI
jgi:hypothetical protein